MKNFVIAAFTAALLATALEVQAEEKKNCVRTVAEAFALGMKLVESKDAQLGMENQLLADTRIRISPEKVNGLYVVEVDSSNKGACDIKPW